MTEAGGPTIPLISTGERTTVRTTTLDGVSGTLASVPRTPRVTAHDALETARTDGFEALRETTVRDLIGVLREASLRFEGVGAVGDSAGFREYEARVSQATGLPVGWVRVSAHWLAFGLRHAAETLRAQSPTGGLGVYDEPSFTREQNVGLAFAPRTRVLGVTMPANDPAVYAWPALALAMKVPVVLRPSDRDPFTAIRLARSLLDAGLPQGAIHVLPGDRSVGETVCNEADHAMAFGGEDAVGQYRDDPSVETYGPGNSVAIVAREPSEREVETLVRGVARAGGRACFNLTRIVATGTCDPNELADELARRLAQVDVGPIDDPRTDVPAFPDATTATRIDERIESLDAPDVTDEHRDGTRFVDRSNVPRLLPTVVRSQTLVDELPFQFAGVTEVDREDVIDRIDGAYLAVCIGDESLERELVRSPTVRKVYGGSYPASVDLRETHETYLASFLYETTTYDPS